MKQNILYTLYIHFKISIILCGFSYQYNKHLFPTKLQYIKGWFWEQINKTQKYLVMVFCQFLLKTKQSDSGIEVLIKKKVNNYFIIRQTAISYEFHSLTYW